MNIKIPGLIPRQEERRKGGGKDRKREREKKRITDLSPHDHTY